MEQEPRPRHVDVDIDLDNQDTPQFSIPFDEVQLLIRHLLPSTEKQQVMTRVLTKARRIRGSIMVRIPEEAVEQEDIHEGESVEIDVHKVRKSWFGTCPGLGPMTREDELDVHDWGRSRFVSLVGASVLLRDEEDGGGNIGGRS